MLPATCRLATPTCRFDMICLKQPTHGTWSGKLQTLAQNLHFKPNPAIQQKPRKSHVNMATSVPETELAVVSLCARCRDAAMFDDGAVWGGC